MSLSSKIYQTSLVLLPCFIIAACSDEHPNSGKDKETSSRSVAQASLTSHSTSTQKEIAPGLQMLKDRSHPLNMVKAVRSLTTAAQGGDAQAAAQLALCYDAGLGCKQDAALAEQYRTQATAAGVDIPSAPLATLSQVEFTPSSPLSIPLDTSALPNYSTLKLDDTAHPKESNSDSDFKPQLSKRLVDSVPAQYSARYTPSSDCVLLANDDIIVTWRDHQEVDIWDSCSLSYLYSLSGIGHSIASSDYFYEYDADHVCLGIRYLPVFLNLRQYSGDDYICGIAVPQMQVDSVQTTLNSQFSLSREPDNLPPAVGKVFKNPYLSQLLSINNPMIYAGDGIWIGGLSPVSVSDARLLKQNAALAPLNFNKVEQSNILSPKRVNLSSLRIAPYVAEPCLDSEMEQTEELDIKNIKGLSQGVDWRCQKTNDGCFHLESMFSTDDPRFKGFLYSKKDDMLIPLPFLNGWSGSGRGMAENSAIGQSDMGWHSVTLYCYYDHFARSYKWMADMVWNRQDNRIYEIITWDNYNNAWNPIEGDPKAKIHGSLKIRPYGGCNRLSVWNSVPGKNNMAYWIAFGENGWGVYAVNLETLQVDTLVFGDQNVTPVWDAEHKHLFVPLSEHVWKLYVIDDTAPSVKELCCIYLHNEKEFAIVLPDGRYAGTPGCESFLQLTMGNTHWDMSALAPWRNRPAEVLETLGGDAAQVKILRLTTERWLSRLGYAPSAMPAEPRPEDFPKLSVARPRLRTSEKNACFPIKLQASTAAAITRVEIRAEGVLVPQTWDADLYVPPGHTCVVQAVVPLLAGQNWLDVTPVDSRGIQGNAERFRIISESAADESCLYVVALGVSDYRDESLKLQYAAKDARDIADTLKQCHYGENKVLLLTNRDVLGASALQQIKAFIANARIQDRVVMYCAGHGLLDDKLDYYFAPSDFELEHIAQTGISMEALLDCLDSTPARTRLMLLDTCHAGFLGEEGEAKMALAASSLPQGVRAIIPRGMKVKKSSQSSHSLSIEQKERYIEELFTVGNTRRGINVLTGSAGAEFALETADCQNGLFTAAVMEALKGAVFTDENYDGSLSVAELAVAVEKSVKTRTGGIQCPSASVLENKGNYSCIPGIGHYISCSNWKAVETLIQNGCSLNEDSPNPPFLWGVEAVYAKVPPSVLAALVQGGVACGKSVPLKTDDWRHGTVLDALVEMKDQYSPQEHLEMACLLARHSPHGASAFVVDYALKEDTDIALLNDLLKYSPETIKEIDLVKVLENLEDEQKIELLLANGANPIAPDSIYLSAWDKYPQYRRLFRKYVSQEALQQYLTSTYRVVRIRMEINGRDSYDEKLFEEHFATEVQDFSEGKKTRQQLLNDFKLLNDNWVQRSYHLLKVARKDNTIQMLVWYECLGRKNKKDINALNDVMGYSLLTVVVDNDGKIIAMDEKNNAHCTPPFALGMSVVDGIELMPCRSSWGMAERTLNYNDLVHKRMQMNSLNLYNESVLETVFSREIEDEQEGGKSLKRLAQDFATLNEKWPQRKYEVLNVYEIGWRKLAIQVSYECSNGKKKIRGYALLTVGMNGELKVDAMGEKGSRKSPPVPSPALKPKLIRYTGQRVFTTQQ